MTLIMAQQQAQRAWHIWETTNNLCALDCWFEFCEYILTVGKDI